MEREQKNTNLTKRYKNLDKNPLPAGFDQIVIKKKLKTASTDQANQNEQNPTQSQDTTQKLNNQQEAHQRRFTEGEVYSGRQNRNDQGNGDQNTAYPFNNNKRQYKRRRHNNRRSRGYNNNKNNRKVQPPHKPSKESIKQIKANLEITKQKDEIVARINDKDNQVIIICGDTGCGKSTQVPQFIYQDHKARNKPCKLLCTQPRRIACQSIVKRIAEEMDIKVGDKIGYHISKEHKVKDATDIIFVTNGMFLNYLTHDPMNLGQYTHIIIDEVHERDIDADLILIIIKSIISSFKDITLVLMSATIKAEVFANYFSREEIAACSKPKENIFNFSLKVIQDLRQRRMTNDGSNRSKATWTGLNEEEEFFGVNDQKNEKKDAYNVKVQSNQPDGSGDQEDDLAEGYKQYDWGAFASTTVIDSWNVDPKAEEKESPERPDRDENRFERGLNNHAAGIITIKQKSKFTIDYVYIDNLKKKLYRAKGVKTELLDWRRITKLRDFNWIGRKAFLIIEAVHVACSIIAFIHWNKDREAGMGAPGGRPGTILVFLPGLNEIYIFIEILGKMLKEGQYERLGIYEELNIIPLHSTLADTSEGEIFSTKDPRRKLIVSTNIAESSLTIPYVNYIIDFCLGKEMAFDPKSGIHKLDLTWASKASCRQRAGRTGRVCNGIVFRMVTEKFYEKFMDYPTPEMLRSPLDKVILKISMLFNKMNSANQDCIDEVKKETQIRERRQRQLEAEFSKKNLKNVNSNPKLGENDQEGKIFDERETELNRQIKLREKILKIFKSPAQVLNRAIDVPRTDQILHSLQTLEESGAFVIKDEQELIGEVTYFGEIYAELPTSIEITKFLMTGYMLNCYKEALVIAGFMIYPKSIYRPNSRNFKRDNKRFMDMMEHFSDQQSSDPILKYRLFKFWCNEYGLDMTSARRTRNIPKWVRGRTERLNKFQFDKRYNLRPNAFIEILGNIHDLRKRLEPFFRVSDDGDDGREKSQAENQILYLKLKICITAANLENLVVGTYKLSNREMWEANYIENMKMDPARTIILNHTDLNHFIKIHKDIKEDEEEEKYPFREKFNALGDAYIVNLWKEKLEEYMDHFFNRWKDRGKSTIDRIEYERGEFIIQFREEACYHTLKMFLYKKDISEYQNKARVYSIDQGSITRDVHENYHSKHLQDQDHMFRGSHRFRTPGNGRKAKSEKELRRDLRRLIEESIKENIGSVTYLYQPKFMALYTGSSINISNESINKIILSTQIQIPKQGIPDQINLISSSMTVNSASRQIANHTSVLPSTPMLPTYLTMIFGNNVALLYDVKYKRLEGIRFMSSDIKFTNWVTEADLSLINRMRWIIRNYMVNGDILKGGSTLWDMIYKLTMETSLTRDKMIHPDEWFDRYLEIEEVEQQEECKFDDLFDELGFLNDDDDVSINPETTQKLNNDQKNGIVVPKTEGMPNSFMMPLQLETGQDFIITENLIKSTAEYLNWKKMILYDIKQVDDLCRIRDTRVCCSVCGQKIIDLRYLKSKKYDRYLVGLDSSKGWSLLEPAEDEHEIRRIEKEYESELRMLKRREKKGIFIESYRTCFKGHLNAVKIRGKEEEFLITTLEYKIKQPDLSEEPLDLNDFDKQELTEAEVLLRLKTRRKLMKGWKCEVCKDERKFNDAAEIAAHLKDKKHIEKVGFFMENVPGIKKTDILGVNA